MERAIKAEYQISGVPSGLFPARHGRLVQDWRRQRAGLDEGSGSAGLGGMRQAGEVVGKRIF